MVYAEAYLRRAGGEVLSGSEKLLPGDLLDTVGGAVMNFEMANWAAVLLLLSPLILAALGWLIAAVSTPLQRPGGENG